MAQRREWKIGRCKECGGPYKRKPADKKFCKARCRSRWHNRHRGRLTGASAVLWIEEHLMTVREAVSAGIGTDRRVRAMVRSGKLRSLRVFGRVLVYRSDGSQERS